MMANKAIFSQSRIGNVMILGGQNQISAELKRILSPFFKKVYLAADLAEGENFAPPERFSLIVVTNSGTVPLNHNFFSKLRVLYPRARLICLVDTISQETEKAMRTAGSLFLGSYRQFGEYYRGILEAALRSNQSL
jgi:hypothetical protein